ncbi:hypothetical protein N7486_011288 [Penicillium sp. IBT 16267x]|nr:hypothetical protein N7486_011288 [Penicillium sp. IBT 16267x]
MHIDIKFTPESETTLPVSATTCPDSSPRTDKTTKPQYLYFAYGSNLSPTQMKQRCIINPSLSAKPLAIATLPKWRWLICEAGYANVLPPQGMRVGPQNSDAVSKVPVSGTEDAVYGVLYELDPADEELLDGYEGVDWDAEDAEDADGSGEVGLGVRPKEQGEGDYNKWYFSANVVKWLDGEEDGEHRFKTESGGQVPVLVYVDEERVMVSPPKTEYISRMNRAIRESVALGVSEKWVEEVIRRFIPVRKF